MVQKIKHFYINTKIKGVGEEAKKKFTFKTSLLYIEDQYLFEEAEADLGQYEHEKRIQMIRDNIESSVAFVSHFKCYYSLLENVIIENYLFIGLFLT